MAGTVVLTRLLVLSVVIAYVSGKILWSKRKFKSDNFVKEFGKNVKLSFGEGNMALAKDPKGGEKKVMRIFYPKGSTTPSRRPVGGAQFYAPVISKRLSAKLTYQVYFAKNFKFVKGGKLPGMMGGTTRTCSGGGDTSNCFSTRFMFRKDGAGEVYLYAPHDQEQNFCKRKGVICNFKFGHSLGRGKWQFKTGRWHTISQYVRLNKIGKRNGYISVWLDGKKVYAAKNLLLRKKSYVKITGLFFSTFFGGSDPSYATPVNTYTYFRNFYFRTS